MADPQPLNRDGAEDGLEVERPAVAELVPSAGFATPSRQDQLLVGMLDQGGEQGPSGLQPGPMDLGLDGVWQVRVLGRQVEADLEVEPDRDGPVVLLDRFEGDGSPGVVDGAHGRSPDRNSGNRRAHRRLRPPACQLGSTLDRPAQFATRKFATARDFFADHRSRFE
jgi:hypothetical protein